MTYVIIHALAPIFVIMLLGFYAGKAKMVDNKMFLYSISS